MMVRSNGLSKENQARISVSFGHISQHLIVGTVFFQDIKSVLNGAGFLTPGEVSNSVLGDCGFTGQRIVDLAAESSWFQLAKLRGRIRLDCSPDESSDPWVVSRSRAGRRIRAGHRI